MGGRTTKNRIHIDIRVAGEPPWDRVARAGPIRVKVDQLLAAGATEVREEQHDDRAGHSILGHVVMLDPEGNEFWSRDHTLKRNSTTSPSAMT